MRHILGVDAGGTKCESLLVREDGICIGWGRWESDGEVSCRGGAGRSSEAITASVSTALFGHRIDELHTSHRMGFAEVVSQVAVKTTSCIPLMHFLEEYNMSFELANVSHGVVALAGTGAFVFCRTPSGDEFLFDGLGPRLGDHGSAYAIGLKCLRAVASAHWSPRRATSLSSRTYATCGLSDGCDRVQRLVEWLADNTDRSIVASFARIVNEEANNRDPISIEILTAAAAQMAETVHDAFDRLQPLTRHYPLIGAGSVMVNSQIYWDSFCKHVAGFAPEIRPVRSDYPPVQGAVLFAARQMGIEDLDGFRTRLHISYINSNEKRIG